MIDIPIRNPYSSKPVKPRLFDIVIDEGIVYVSIKKAQETHVILLSDVMQQVKTALPEMNIAEFRDYRAN